MPEITVEALEARLGEAEAKLAALAEGPIVLPLTSLAPEPYEIVGQIHILIQPAQEGYVAYYLDANLGVSGETKAEALNGVKDRIISTYERFIEKPDEKLGPGPLRQKQVLASHIRRR